MKALLPAPHLHLGTAVMPDLLSADPRYGATVEREFNSVTVEHHMKWAPLLADKRGLGAYDFAQADLVVDWALSKGLTVKGHTLIWHVTSPAELLEPLNCVQMLEAMRRHIHTTAGHFYGRVQSWDVINEALAPDGTLAKSLFHSKLGPQVDWMHECFRWAKLADPGPMLLYNDNKVEGICPKSDAMVDLLSRLKALGTPIDGVGLQAHFDATGVGLRRPASPKSLKENLDRLAAMGLKVNLSEMDVRVKKLNYRGDIDQVQAQIYRDTLSACFAHRAFQGCTFWGFTDAHTWCDAFYAPGSDPLLFNRNYAPKLSYYAVLDALKPGAQWAQTWEDQPWYPRSPPPPAKKQLLTNEAGTALPDWEFE